MIYTSYGLECSSASGDLFTLSVSLAPVLLEPDALTRFPPIPSEQINKTFQQNNYRYL